MSSSTRAVQQRKKNLCHFSCDFSDQNRALLWGCLHSDRGLKGMLDFCTGDWHLWKILSLVSLWMKFLEVFHPHWRFYSDQAAEPLKSPGKWSACLCFAWKKACGFENWCPHPWKNMCQILQILGYCLEGCSKVLVKSNQLIYILQLVYFVIY